MRTAGTVNRFAQELEVAGRRTGENSQLARGRAHHKRFAGEDGGGDQPAATAHRSHRPARTVQGVAGQSEILQPYPHNSTPNIIDYLFSALRTKPREVQRAEGEERESGARSSEAEGLEQTAARQEGRSGRTRERAGRESRNQG